MKERPMERPRVAGRNPSDGWTEVRRRRSRRENQWNNELETTFFIENLPEETSNRVLWLSFGSTGRLSDAYVAKKKDSAGNRFGFLRYLNVKDVNVILEKANGVRVLEAVVKVSLARFDRNHRKFNYPTAAPRANQSSGQTFKPTNMGNEWQDSGRRFQLGGLSYKEALNNSKPESPVRKTIMLTGEEGLLQKHWYGKVVVGESKDVKGLMEVNNMLKMEGFPEVALRYVGGLKTMVTFHDKKQALDFMNNKRQWWGDCFETVKLWNGEDSPKERLAKLRVRGIPIQLREDEVYNVIGNYYGKVVGSSDFSWDSRDASEGSCIVLVNQWGRVDEVANVIWKGRNFEVAVTEIDWYPAFGEVACLEEGELRVSSPEKMGIVTGGTERLERRKMGGEGSEVGNNLHGEGLDVGNNLHGEEGLEVGNILYGEEGFFNVGSEKVQENFFEGNFEPYAEGCDMSRKRKRRRANKSPLANKDQTGPKSCTGTRLLEKLGLGSQMNEGQSNEQNGSFINVNSQQEGGENGVCTGGNSHSDQGVESGEMNENPEMDIDQNNRVNSGLQDAIIEENNETIRTGESIGIQLKDFRKDVEGLVSGDGVFEV